MSYPVFVNMLFPNADLARRFLLWMANGGGEDDFAAHVAESSDPVALVLDYDDKTMTIRATIAREES